MGWDDSPYDSSPEFGYWGANQKRVQEQINQEKQAEAKRRASLTPAQRAAEDFQAKQKYIAINCKDIEGIVIQKAAQIRNEIQSLKFDGYSLVISKINELEAKTKSCQFDLRKVGLHSGIYQIWKDQVYEVPLKHYQGEILKQLRFRKGLPYSEIAEFKKFAALIGMTEDEIKQKVAPWLKYCNQVTLNLLEYKLNHRSQYVDVTHDSDIKKYRELSKELSNNEGETEQTIQKWIEQGKKSVVREKESCQPKLDIRTPALGKVREQGEMRWCTHVALADVLTYKLGQRISAADIAVQFYDHPALRALKAVTGTSDAEMFSGLEVIALERLKQEGGACLESKFQMEGVSYASFQDALRDIDTIKKYDLAGNDPVCKKHYESPLQAIFPNVKDPYGILQSSSRVRIFKHLADEACGKRIDVSQIKANFELAISESGKKKALQIIDEQLSKKNIVSIDFDSVVIQPSKSSWHSNSIVGRRFNPSKNRCEYLIRTTWGTDFTHDWDLEKEGGYIWIPKWSLMQTLLGVTTYE